MAREVIYAPLNSPKAVTMGQQVPSFRWLSTLPHRL